MKSKNVKSKLKPSQRCGGRVKVRVQGDDVIKVERRRVKARVTRTYDRIKVEGRRVAAETAMVEVH